MHELVTAEQYDGWSEDQCRPDVIVYRAETIDEMPGRPEHILLLVEIVSPGSETADRTVKAVEYAQAGICYYWRIEDATTPMPVVHTYVLDEASRTYRATESSPA